MRLSVCEAATVLGALQQCQGFAAHGPLQFSARAAVSTQLQHRRAGTCACPHMSLFGADAHSISAAAWIAYQVPSSIALNPTC
jgi:hypothetical protein